MNYFGYFDLWWKRSRDHKPIFRLPTSKAASEDSRTQVPSLQLLLQDQTVQ